MDTIKYLDAIKAKHGLPSDYALAAPLEIGYSENRVEKE